MAGSPGARPTAHTEFIYTSGILLFGFEFRSIHSGALLTGVAGAPPRAPYVS